MSIASSQSILHHRLSKERFSIAKEHSKKGRRSRQPVSLWRQENSFLGNRLYSSTAAAATRTLSMRSSSSKNACSNSTGSSIADAVATSDAKDAVMFDETAAVCKDDLKSRMQSSMQSNDPPPMELVDSILEQLQQFSSTTKIDFREAQSLHEYLQQQHLLFESVDDLQQERRQLTMQSLRNNNVDKADSTSAGATTTSASTMATTPSIETAATATASMSTSASTAIWLRRLKLQIMLRLHLWARYGYDSDRIYMELMRKPRALSKKTKRIKTKTKRRKSTKQTTTTDTATSHVLLNDIIALLSLAALCLVPPVRVFETPTGEDSSSTTSPTTVVLQTVSAPTTVARTEDTPSAAADSSDTTSASQQQADDSLPESFWEFLNACCQHSSSTDTKNNLIAPIHTVVQQIYDHFELPNPFSTLVKTSDKGSSACGNAKHAMSPLPKKKRKHREEDTITGRIAASTVETISTSSSTASVSSSTMIATGSEDGSSDMRSNASVLRLGSAVTASARFLTKSKAANPLLQGSSRRFTGSHFHTDLSSHAFEQVVANKPKTTSLNGTRGQCHQMQPSGTSVQARGASINAKLQAPPPPSNVLAPATPSAKKNKPAEFVIAETPQPKKKNNGCRRSSLKW